MAEKGESVSQYLYRHLPQTRKDNRLPSNKSLVTENILTDQFVHDFDIIKMHFTYRRFL